MTPVTIVATGVANTASVSTSLRRCGASVQITDDPAQVRDAEALVLPGVGSFAAGMERLRERGLDVPIIERIGEGRPMLAICLGLQLLFEGSDESPGVAGLGVIPGVIRRFDPSVRTPQFGWSRVEAGTGCAVLDSGDAYFANSYRVGEPPQGWVAATSEHGARFVAALERGPVVACQFHPELSGSWGLALLTRWLALVPAKEATPC